MNDHPNYSKLIYSAVGTGVIAILGGLYYCYSMMKNEYELSEEDINKIEELKEDVEQTKGILNTETAIKLLAMINKKTDEYINTNKPDVEKQRREAFDNPEEYETICNEMLEFRNKVYMSVTDKILTEFGISNDDLGKCLHGISPIDIEKKMFSIEKPSFDNNNNIPEKPFVKGAFIYYGRNCIEQMRKFQKMMNKAGSDPYQQEVVLYELMILKFKIDDELFRQYKINESQLRYLLYEYNLYEDVDIKSLMEKMAKYEEMLNAGD